MNQKPIRLFWGENYSTKPQVVWDAIDTAIEESKKTLHLYPGSLYSEVIKLIAETIKVKPEQIILGHGIEGLVNLTSKAFLPPEKKGGMLMPSFYAYDFYLKRAQSPTYYSTHYDKKIDVDDFIKKIENTDIFFAASPNTATGKYEFDTDEIEYIVKKYKGIFVVDECYFGIGDQTAISFVHDNKNLLIYRGVTKVMGMGGLRFAYAVGDKNIIEKLRYFLNDTEFDPINTFSLNIFKYTFPYFQELADTTNQFITDFLAFMQKEFPDTKFIRNLITYHFMDMKAFNTPTYQVMNYLSKHGYLMSEKELSDNSSIDFPEFLEIAIPPKDLWEDFAKTLKEALKQTSE